MAETAQQKVDKDLKTLPKSVPTPKPLNYVGNPNPEVQGTRFGNLELRADLDSRMALMPIARLGYDIIERGLLDPEAGEMGGDIRAVFLPLEAQYRDNILGRMLPSDDLNPRGFSNTDKIKEAYSETGTSFSKKAGFLPRDLEVMGRGVASLLSPDRGTTVMFDADQPETEIKDGKVVRKKGTVSNAVNLNTLMEELAHVGVRELERRGIDVRNLSTEERAMDMLQAELALSENMVPKSEQQLNDMAVIKNEYMNIPRNVLEDYNKAALAILDERGVPRRAVPKKQETGMVDSMLNFFGLK